MDPKASQTILSLLQNVPGGQSPAAKFLLLFQATAKQATDQGQALTLVSGQNLTHTTKVGTEVNVSGQLVGGLSTSPSGSRGCTEQSKSLPIVDADPMVDIPIKVINPIRREAKTYLLNLQIGKIGNLKCLREEILEQLGKRVIKSFLIIVILNKFFVHIHYSQ